MDNLELINNSADVLWKDLCSIFPILGATKSIEHDQNKINYIIDEINSNQLADFIEDQVFNKIDDELRLNVTPKFWQYFINSEDDMKGFEHFKTGVETLYTSLSLFLPNLENLNLLRMRNNSFCGRTSNVVYGEDKVMNTFKVIVRASLFAKLPLKHQVITEQFYRVAFKVFCKTDSGKPDPDVNDSTDDGGQCNGCMVQVENCHCEEILNIFHSTNQKLFELELLERLSGEVLTILIHKKIETYVLERCKGSFDTSYLTPLDDWLQSVVMGWLSKIYNSVDNENQSEKMLLAKKEALVKFKHKLQHLLYETYTRTRIDQLFDIIIEYPDSDPAIEDLKTCLLKTDLRQFLTQKLQRMLETRLLHQGVNTLDILTAYVAAIKALRQLDPTGVLLETVTKPIRTYLRSRDDTVRNVITSLTDDGSNDLSEELNQGEPPVEEEFEDEIDTENWATWKPDPVDADPSKTSKSRTSDIISMLVNIYGSKESFVTEYRTLLADRLMKNFTHHLEKEIRYLELLKLRFGESQLHNCEVMVKDIYDSRRLNNTLQSEFDLSQPFLTCAYVLSAQFWPVFKEDTLKLPDIVNECFENYTKAFETSKGNRTLCWKPHLGSVWVEIILKDRVINLNVLPIHATIVWHYQTKSQWTIDELSKEMHVSPTVLRKKITFWQSQGLLRETTTDLFVLIEENTNKSKSLITEMLCEDEENESAMASAHDQREEELQVFWSYIVGMLTNLDSLPLERIHQMLKMFASQGPSVECSLQELRNFLDRKVREHKLIFTGGLYRLPKS